MAVSRRTDPDRPKPPRARRGQGTKQARGAAREGWPPAILTPVPEPDVAAGDGEDILAFIDAYGVVTKDSIGGKTGQKLTYLPWQRRAVREIFARRTDTGRRRHRIALFATGRKNGKSSWAAPIAARELVLGPQGGEIYSCAADRAQAHLIFGTTKRTIELNPELAAECRIYRDAIEHTPSGSVYRALSSEAYTKEGLSPTLVIADELHAWPDRELYDVMQLAMGARVDPLMLIVTTAGVRTDTTGQDSICYQLYQYGERVASGEVADASFYMAWWKARDDAPIYDESEWEAANPGLDVVLDRDDLRTAALRTPEPELRTKRLNCFVATINAWLPAGAFEALASERRLKPHERVVLGFDGSFNNDTSVIVAATLDGHIEILGLWERPDDAVDWQVPMAEVERAVLDACKTYDVVEIAADPYRWARELQAWEVARLPVLEYATTSPARMVPACAKFHDAVKTQAITHAGDPRLERHVRNAVLKVDRLGPRIVKEHRGSPRKIDAAVAAVMAYDRATWHAENGKRPRGVGAFVA